jgi:hypothetical protein
MKFEEFLNSIKSIGLGEEVVLGKCRVTCRKDFYYDDLMTYDMIAGYDTIRMMQVYGGNYKIKDNEDLKKIYEYFNKFNCYYDLIYGNMWVGDCYIKNINELHEKLSNHIGVEVQRVGWIDYHTNEKEFRYKILDLTYSLLRIKLVEGIYTEEYHLYINDIKMTKHKIQVLNDILDINYSTLFYIMVGRTEVERQLKLNELINHGI